jgi:hypothetical protein
MMKRRALIQSISSAAVLPSSVLSAMCSAARRERGDAGPVGSTVYELRVYHAAAGKLGELLARFRDHTDKIFERHAMKSVAYWTPVDEPQKSATLIYILEHASREAATANWKAFQEDAEWKGVREKSEENGKLVEKVDSTFMELTDFSRRLA